MTNVTYEYKVMPAPQKGQKARGAKTHADRFCVGMSALMNDMALDGWEYWRAETLPFEERSVLGRKTSGVHSVLVFRRVLCDEAEMTAPTGAPSVTAPQPSVVGPKTPVRAAAKAPEKQPVVSSTGQKLRREQSDEPATMDYDDQVPLGDHTDVGSTADDTAKSLTADQPNWLKDKR